MSLGSVCRWYVSHVDRHGREILVNRLTEHSLQVGRLKRGLYSREFLANTYKENAESLADMAPVIADLVGCFRISSSILPLTDLVDRELWDNTAVRDHLARAGEVFRSRGTRVTMHPGQFVVLNSVRPQVIENSKRELELHAWVLDAMQMPESPYASINVHGGARGRSRELSESISSLPHNVRSRLTLENDESSYSLCELYTVHEQTGVPLVFDSHHHSFNACFLSEEDAFHVACSTWPSNVRPLQHVSNSAEPGGTLQMRKKHSDYLTSIPVVQLEAVKSEEIDLEVEAKTLNLALALARADFEIW